MTNEVSTDREHWAGLQTSWDRRASVAGALLKGEAAVVDIGCGGMSLERYLAPLTRYIPVDVVPRDNRTTVVDLNVERLPRFDAKCAAVLGVVEYLNDPADFFEQLRAFDKVILSYNHWNFKDAYWTLRGKHRRPVKWTNRFRVNKVRKLISDAGFVIKRERALGVGERLYEILLERR